MTRHHISELLFSSLNKFMQKMAQNPTKWVSQCATYWGNCQTWEWEGDRGGTWAPPCEPGKLNPWGCLKLQAGAAPWVLQNTLLVAGLGGRDWEQLCQGPAEVLLIRGVVCYLLFICTSPHIELHIQICIIWISDWTWRDIINNNIVNKHWNAFEGN